MYKPTRWNYKEYFRNLSKFKRSKELESKSRDDNISSVQQFRFATFFTQIGGFVENVFHLAAI